MFHGHSYIVTILPKDLFIPHVDGISCFYLGILELTRPKFFNTRVIGTMIMGFDADLNIIFVLIIAGTCYHAISSLTNSAYADSLNPAIYSTKEKPFGVPYQEWLAAWWNWTFGMTEDEHPRDTVSRSCNIHQNGPVWFLPDPLNIEDVSNPRICDVPHGKAIFVPVVAGEVSTLEKPGYSDANLVKEAIACNEYSKNRQAEIDGVKIVGLDDKNTYRTNSSQVFNVTIVDGNIYNIKSGTGRAFADGWSLFLKPLEPGEHKLHLVGSIVSPTGACDSSGDVNWIIRVK